MSFTKKKISKSYAIPDCSQQQLYEICLAKVEHDLKLLGQQNAALQIKCVAVPKAHAIKLSHSWFDAQIAFFDHKIEILGTLSLLALPIEHRIMQIIDQFVEHVKVHRQEAKRT